VSLKICPNIPKIIVKESDIPEGMTHEDLEKALYPGLRALARLFAKHELREREKKGGNAV
jgi:hypothetical protein